MDCHRISCVMFVSFQLFWSTAASYTPAMGKQLMGKQKEAVAKKAAKDNIKSMPFTVKVNKGLSPLPRNMCQKQREWILAGLKHLKAPVAPLLL